MPDDDRVRKTFYPHEDAGEWIEDMAEQSDRSESYVVVATVETVKAALGDEHDNIDRLLEDLENRLD